MATTKKKPVQKVARPRAAGTPHGVRINLPGKYLLTIPPNKLADLRHLALSWTYALRNRERWNTQPEVDLAQQQAMVKLGAAFGLTESHYKAIVAAGLVEVEIGWTDKEAGWEQRIFPWEYLLAAATRDLRGGHPLTVVRHLRVGPRKPSAAPKRWLQVVSAPGSLKRVYEFESERALVRLGVGDAEMLMLDDPDEQGLRESIAAASPDVIHLAGFDPHQAAQLDSAFDGKASDGYYLRGPKREAVSIGAKALAKILTGGRKAPRLVACNLYNSGQRIAPLAVAEGAGAAIGFQDSFDDGLAECFFATLYMSWPLAGWDIVRAFEYAWHAVRRQNKPLQGSGIVLWNSVSIAARAPRRYGEASIADIGNQWKKHLKVPVTAETLKDCLEVDVAVIERLNYSILHNNGPMFERFQIRKKQAGVGEVSGLMVDIEVNVGTDSYPYRTEVCIGETEPLVDLPDSIRISLASALSRSLRESVHTSLFVSVTWKGAVLYRQTHRVTLLPVDEWRFDSDNYRWLPSFVLPRDPAVNRIVDSAQRYLMALTDDATAGFDGYQSVSFRGKLPRPAQCAVVDLQVRALWSALLYDVPLSYINPPPAFTNLSQRLRTPSDCTDSRRGTCIDLALLLAACLEYVEIYPAIFLLESHAFPAYWRHESFHEAFVEARGAVPEAPQGEMEVALRNIGRGQAFGWDFQRSQYRELVREVHAGRLVPLETTLVTGRGSFRDALRIGLENVASREEFESMLDITLARTERGGSITPLPIRRGEA